MKDDEFLSAVKGVAFLGVPHHGSGVVELGKYFAYLLRSITRKTNSDLLADLDTRSKVLSNICIDATHLICQLQIITFYETRNFPGLGRLVRHTATLTCAPIHKRLTSMPDRRRGLSPPELSKRRSYPHQCRPWLDMQIRFRRRQLRADRRLNRSPSNSNHRSAPSHGTPGPKTDRPHCHVG